MNSFIRILGVCNLALCIGIGITACSDDEDGEGDLSASGATGSGSTGSGTGGSGGASTGSGGSSSGGTSTGTGGTSSGSGGTSTGSGGTFGNIPTEACEGLPFDDTGAGGAEACTGVGYEAESVPVDLFIMMDRSQSMGYVLESGETRWEALRGAVESFIDSQSAGDIRMGIGFFNRSGGANDTVDCQSAEYAEPEVEIGDLEDVGADILAAIDGITPGGLTPTVPAIEGAISHAKEWAEENPERATVVVLVTDGYPTQCSSAPEAVSQAAEAGLNNEPYIRTYVIGVGDVAKFNLDNYARAGGTNEAYVTDDANVGEAFVEALLNITNSKLACEYQIPDPGGNMQVNPDEVQVVYTPAVGDAEEVPRVNSIADCATAANGGWYYDNPAAPTKITVCPCTCTRFAAGGVEVALGCEPRLGIR